MKNLTVVKNIGTTPFEEKWSLAFIEEPDDTLEPTKITEETP